MRTGAGKHGNEIRCAIEYRADESRRSAGRLTGVLLRYGERAADRAEVFAVDSLSWDSAGVVLNVQHDRQQAIARFVPQVRQGAVTIDVSIPDTQRGRDAVTMVREGVYRGLSVEFQPVKDSWDGDTRTIEAARLMGAAVVDSPAYAGSAVEARGACARGSWLLQVVPWL